MGTQAGAGAILPGVKRAPKLRLLLAATLIHGCSSEPAAKDDSSPIPVPPVKCEGPGYAEAAPSQFIASVSATLVDQAGDPVANELVQVCGVDLCVAGESSAAGGVLLGPMQAMKRPAFKFGEGKHSARFAWLLPADTPEVDLGTVRTVLLPPLGSGAALTPGEEASSGGLSLLPAAGGNIRFDRLTFRSGEEQQLRAVRLDVTTAPAVVAPELGFEIVYATTPVDTAFCPPAELRIENSEGWAPGTEVEVWLHGVHVEQEWAPYGGWAKVSTAQVSADASRIETSAAGLPFLGVLGFKRR